MSEERGGFYPKTVHVLFAVVLATSFPLASKTLIPISAAFEPDTFPTTLTLALAYLVVVTSWVGYARSVSRWQYRDTRWGALRFALDIQILFMYFYLLQITLSDHAGDTPFVMTVLAGMYLVSDMVKRIDRSRQHRPPIQRRTKHTINLLAWTALVACANHFGLLNWVADVLAITPQLLSTIICAALAVWYRASKWNVYGGSGPVRTT